MSVSADPSPSRQGDVHQQGYVSFRVGGQWLGIPVFLVQEVLTQQAISPVPLAPNGISGFLNLRGQIVTAIDLRTRLGVVPRTAEDASMNIVVRDQEELFSFVVDEVGDVVEVSTDRVEPTPPTLDERWRECCQGVTRLEGALLVVVDVQALLRIETVAG